MARQNEICYINYYISGSAAYQVEQKPVKQKAKLPRMRRKKKIVVHVDPMATLGIFVACVMFVLMVVGAVRLGAVRQQAEQMNDYVSQLQNETAQLRTTYEQGYDLEEIRAIAEARGMIPIEDAQQVQIRVEIPEETEEPTAWESFVTFLTGLFA